MDKKSRHRTTFRDNDIVAMNAMILGGKDVGEIASLFGCHHTTVRRRKDMLLKGVGV